MSNTVSAQQIEWLWKQFKNTGDAHTEKRIVEYYLPLVEQVVARMAPGLPATVAKDDLISLGIFGLIDAVRKFDPDRGLKFTTYANWRIRGAIIDGLRESDWLPRSLRDKAKKIEEAYAKLEQERMGSVSEAEVCQYLGMTREEMQKVLQETATASFYSLDEPILDEEDQESDRHEYIEDPSVANPEEEAVRKQIRELLVQAIERLPEKEKLVLSLFYYEELSFTEIAEVLNLSTSRISQLHSKAIHRLRNVLGKRKELLR